MPSSRRSRYPTRAPKASSSPRAPTSAGGACTRRANHNRRGGRIRRPQGVAGGSHPDCDRAAVNARRRQADSAGCQSTLRQDLRRDGFDGAAAPHAEDAAVLLGCPQQHQNLPNHEMTTIAGDLSANAIPTITNVPVAQGYWCTALTTPAIGQRVSMRLSSGVWYCGLVAGVVSLGGP